MGRATKLSHLQKWRRGGDGELQRQFQQTDKNSQIHSRNYSSQTQDKKQAQAQSLQVHQRQLGTTKPAHLNTVLQCAGPIHRTDVFEERVGGENGMT